MRVVPIERAVAPSAAEFRARFQRPRRPVVITSAIDHWPALSWSLEGLARRYPDRIVPVRVASDPSQRFQGDERRTFRRVRMPLGELESALREDPRAGERLYLQASHIPTDLPGLERDVPKPIYCPRFHLSPPLLFVNGPGAIAPPHYDYNHVLMAGVTGEKRYVLVAPEDSAKISGAIARTLWRTSPIDLAHPDSATREALRDVTLHEHVLRAGELLFIPYEWWHHMDATEASISVSWWWQPSTFHRVRDELFYLSLQPLRILSRRAQG